MMEGIHNSSKGPGAWILENIVTLIFIDRKSVV